MPKKEISLLPQEEFEKKPLGKFLLWALTVGRWIVIVTELIVILAFLSRFKLDRDLADLYEAIRTKQAIVASFSSFEENFRSLQNQLLTIDKLEKTPLETSKIFSLISQAVPPEVVLNQLSFGEKTLNLSGVAFSETGLGNFLNTLALSPNLTEINLTNISKQTGEGQIQFSLTSKVQY